MDGNILQKRHRPRRYGCKWHPNHVVVSGRKKNCVYDSGRFTREGLYVIMSPWTRFSSHLLTFPPSPSSPPSLPQASTTEAAENLIAEGIPARILELHALHQVRGKGEEVRRHSFALYICEAILTLLLLCTCFQFAVPRPFPPFQHFLLSPLFSPFLSPPIPSPCPIVPSLPLTVPSNRRKCLRSDRGPDQHRGLLPSLSPFPRKPTLPSRTHGRGTWWRGGKGGSGKSRGSGERRGRRGRGRKDRPRQCRGLRAFSPGQGVGSSARGRLGGVKVREGC